MGSMYLAQNQYNELSQLSSKSVGNGLQIINYNYNIRGWMTKINDPANLNGKLFGYEIKYQNPANPTLAPAKYNGNIAEVDWRTSNDGILRRYGYQYDALNRLQKGIYQEPNASVPQNNFYNEELTYDVNGNIQNLKRNTKNIANLAEQIDNLQYSYIGNQLSTVTDSSLNYQGYPDTSGIPITYDSNGNMKNHIDKGIVSINYNHLNLPSGISFNENFIVRYGKSTTQTFYNVNTQYLYRADGAKLKKIYSGKGQLTGDETYSLKKTYTEYLDGFQYEAFAYSGILAAEPAQVLKFVPTSEGYYNFEKNSYIYNYVDHLGNIRLSFFKNSNNSAEVLEENNYYPFGLEHQGYNSLAGNPAFRYSYNNKELQTDTGWMDYGARNYMSDLGRWNVVDPLAEKYLSWTPYVYTLNSPTNYIDPFGLDVYRLGADGSIEWVSESKEDQIYAANQFNKDNSLIKDAKGFTAGEQGYISKHTVSGSYTNSKGEEKQYSMITFSNENTALGLHEYISNNVNAEFSVATGTKNGEQQSFVGKNGLLTDPASAGSVNVVSALNYFDDNSITLFGHNHPDMAYQIEPSGYEVKMKGWKNHDFTGFENISVGNQVKNGDYNTSSYFPASAILFMYNPSYFTGSKTVFYNKEEVTSIKNGYHKNNKK